MSTTTNFKRIALVAVAALGLSIVSVVPSNAAVVGAVAVTTVNGAIDVNSAGYARSDSTTAATINLSAFTNAGTIDTILVKFTPGTFPTGSATFDTRSLRIVALDTASATGVVTTLKGNSGTGQTVDVTGTYTHGSDSASVGNGGVGLLTNAGVGTLGGKFGVFLDSAMVKTAGTYTIDYSIQVYGVGNGGSAATGERLDLAKSGTMSIVVTTAGTTTGTVVGAAATSSAVMYGGATFPTGTVIDSTTVTAVNTPSTSTAAAVIRVTQLTAAGLVARESITATSTIGNIGLCGGTIGKSVIIQATSDGVDDVCIYPDGTAGASAVTLKTASVTFANRTVTFYGTTAATITATVLATTIGSSSVNAILAVAKDSLGTNIRSADAVYAYSDAVTIINTGTAPAGTSCGSYSSTYGGYLCPLTGSNNGTANITIRNASTSTLATVSSTAVAIKVNTAAVASVKLEFDKASYAPGEAAWIIVRPLDATGAAVGATTVTNALTTAGITSTVAFGNGSTASETLAAVLSPAVSSKVAAIDGYASATAIAIYRVYMPAAGGTVKIEATGGTGLPSAGRVALSATATVTDNGAAALAAVTALATTVASLKTLITTLTNLVLKIQKKVKA
ncbi:hypothetical protein B1s21160_05710 [Candidatus Nanopelagicus hibericus]|uniref:Uncharacterized protein n=1 Tax=Candidatus Nanopelagicus hibericus TaxID=1884915 RepID=A0A249KAG8_9ACTN|nr:hypothetical protein [Candidatus Nanopelagicus hibericus]ASY13794.1 hypothetical protein B1s21160_05710 [Candidatus Nanopelagicus hibericus]